MRVGVEVGGTFTDLVAVEDGRVIVAKVPSVPARPDEGAFDALDDAGIAAAEVVELVHGSTVATNAVLERKGVRVAFVTTRGFRDILHLQRGDRRRIYDLRYRKPEPLARRRDCFEVAERVLADGSIALPLDAGPVIETLIPALAASGVEAVALCLLNAYANPIHEEALAALIGERLPGLHVTCSSDVTREYREYERASTTALSAYVQPVIDAYLDRFAKRLAGSGFTGRLSIMQSNGGRLPADAMRRSAVTALYSGPAAGVMGAVRQVGTSGYRDIITLDIGGTSTDVCLVEDGRPTLASEADIDGLPIRVPVLDIVTVGAGGGSIVWRDEGGMLRVGPQSAGADPGPACYGRGGEAPTVTDAHMVRGTIRPEARLGGHLTLDGGAARAALAPLAADYAMDVEGFADGALRLADAGIVRAIELVSTERGRDARDYVLVSYGGAGPLHAARVAEALGMGTVVVPPNAGVMSAFGLIASDYLQFETVTRRVAVDADAPAEVRGILAAMRGEAVRRFATLGLGGEPRFTFTLHMRFVGQAFEIEVELPVERFGELTADTLRDAFSAAHQRVYFHGAEGGREIEIVSFRLGIAAPLAEVPRLVESGGGGNGGRTCTIFENRVRVDCMVMARGGIAPAREIDGAALIEDATSTIYVPPGWRARRDSGDNLVIEHMRGQE